MIFIKKHKVFLSVLLLLIIIFGCYIIFVRSDISVIHTSWSGDEKDYVPKETVTNHSVSMFKTVKYDKPDFSFTVLFSSKNNIVILTDEAMSEGTRSINLKTNKRIFIINRGEKLQLTTPTTDFGHIYIFSLE